MSKQPSMFRHDPSKAVLTLKGSARVPVNWSSEPAVCGFRRFSHEMEGADSIAVPLCASPAVVTGAGVVMAGYDGRVSFLNRNLEKVFWTQRLDGPVYASLVVDAERRTVIAATTTGRVACFGLRGEAFWSIRLGVPVYATPTILHDSGALVVAAFHSRCFGISLDTGVVLFERSLPQPWHAEFGGSAVHRDPYASPVTTEDGNAILCCAEHVARRRCRLCTCRGGGRARSGTLA